MKSSIKTLVSLTLVLCASACKTTYVATPTSAPETPVASQPQTTLPSVPTTTDTPVPGVLIPGPPDLTLPQDSVARIQVGAELRELAFSPNGVQIALTSPLGVLTYQSESLQPIMALQAEGELSEVAWSPDGMRLAAGSNDGKVLIWDTTTAEAIATFQVGADIIASLSWSPDGQRLAIGVFGESARVLDVENGEDTVVLDVDSNQYPFVAWSPNAERLAGGCNCTDSVLWNTVTGERLFALEGYRDDELVIAWAQSIAWSPAGDKVAIGMVEDVSVIRVYDPENGETIAQLMGHSEEVQALSWSPDGRLLASGSSDGTVRIWDLVHKQQLVVQDNVGLVRSLAWSPAGTSIAIINQDGILIVWDVRELLE